MLAKVSLLGSAFPLNVVIPMVIMTLNSSIRAEVCVWIITSVKRVAWRH